VRPLLWLVRLLIYGLAVYRVTHLLCYERGPLDVFDWLRSKAGIEEVTTYMIGRQPRTATERVAIGFWAELLSCPLCLSVWLSALAVVALLLDWPVLDIGALWLALAGISLVFFGGEKVE
jgi:hypothetical protein